MPSSMADPSLAGRVAVVTGASSGIGRVTARTLARRGATVIVVARRAALLDSLVAECRTDAPASFALAGDLGERAFAEQVVADTVVRTGRLDVLVNNAALSKHKHILDVTPDEVDLVMRVNFMACVWTTLAAMPHFFHAGGGTIVNVSSFAAKVTPAREAVYAASKAAMNAFSEGLWHDLKGSGIHVAIVNPGPIDTEIWEKTDEPTAYHGRKYPPDLVADAIVDAIVHRRFECTVPARNPMLVTARFLRLLAPGLMRAGMAHMDPVAPEVFAKARERAKRG
jgi:short-subunit dehydrogenase